MSNTVGQVTRLVPGLQKGIEKSGAVTGDEGGANFTEMFGKMLNSVNNLQTEAARAQQLAATGEAADLHQVMIAVEEAGISMDLLLEIRNKLVDAYQTLVRMPM
ncbi:Flagellar hook-basal body complex protein FliE [Candidatus Zixiibacteriota bacterium]|nr:Flagellar hook-basal body complex protein FliE [candidate division Zixibacteria bacterium]